MSPIIKGYTLGAIAAATYGMNPLFALPLYADGIEPLSVLFFRYLFAIPILIIMLKSRGRSLTLPLKYLAPAAFFGLLFALSSFTLFQSYNYMDAGIASTLLFVYPILVALIMSIFFKEKLQPSTMACIAAALLGISLLYETSDGTTLNLTGVLYVVASSLSYAIYIVGVNQTRLREVPTLSITLYVIIIGFLLFSGMLLHQGEIQTPSQWWLWGNMVALGLFPTVISLFCTTAAIQLIGSTPTAILGALEPLTAVIFGVTVFGEQITPRICLGFVLIIGSVSLVVARGNLTVKLLRLRKMFPKLRRGK